MENKNNNQGALLKSFLLMTVVLGFIGGFVLSSDLKNIFDKAIVNNESENSNESNEIFTAGLKSNKTFGFDERYVEPKGEYDYNIDFGTYAGTTDSYFKLDYGNSRKSLKITRYNYDNENVQTYTLDFASEVVDIFLGQFKNDPLNNTILYLLDNGDVCYSFIEDMVRSDKYGTYTTISEIADAVKFYKGNACTEEEVCETTTFVQLKSGKIIDLKNYIVK